MFGHPALSTLLPTISFGCAALIAIASSVWLRPGRPLGKPFWILSFVVTVPVLASVAAFVLTPPDPYGFSLMVLLPSVLFFGPVAAGWLLGVIAVVLVRVVRANGQLTS